MTPTIESLLAEAKEVIAKLQAEVNAHEAKPKQPVTARVAFDETYLYITDGGGVGRHFEQNRAIDQYRFDSGNYASDTPEGRAYLERKQRRDLAKVRLERKRDELGGFVTAGKQYALVPTKRAGAWQPWISGGASAFAFKVEGEKEMREFVHSMSADLDIYFGEAA